MKEEKLLVGLALVGQRKTHTFAVILNIGICTSGLSWTSLNKSVLSSKNETVWHHW